MKIGDKVKFESEEHDEPWRNINDIYIVTSVTLKYNETRDKLYSMVELKDVPIKYPIYKLRIVGSEKEYDLY